MAEDDKKKQPPQADEDRGSKVALLSGKGLIVVLLLLALEAVGGFALYYFALGSKGVADDAAPPSSLLEGSKIRIVVVDPNKPDNQRNVSLEYSIEVKPEVADDVKKELAAVAPILKARILERVRKIAIDDLAKDTTLEDLKKSMVDIHNMTLREKSSKAMREKLGDEPIVRVWITDYQVMK